MEKIEWLIDKLKRQYDASAGATAMLNTLQLLQQELVTQTTATPAVQRISVVMPAPKWNANAIDELDEYETENLRSNDEHKVVFELDPYIEDEVDEPADEEITVPEPIMQTPAPFIYLPIQKESVAEPEVPEKTEFTMPVSISLPSIEAVVMPNPVPTTDKKSLNELHEAPLPEVYNRYHEPIKDLKRAISINDRYQYINNLFGGDEAVYDRSIKTINHFNVFSEAEYWIRREVSIKYGWEESDRLVQQFYDLVNRRFA